MRAGARDSASTRARRVDAASDIFSPTSATPQISQRSRLVPTTPPVRAATSSSVISKVFCRSWMRADTR
jgi:hypothetical protein